MRKRLYVGNLSQEMTASELTELFAQAGEINTVKIVTNRATGRSKGFAFVEMEQGGDEAIAVFNGKNLMGRVLTVIDARGSLYVVTPVKNTSLLR
jgi:cold-inducible RNA-binding protein